MGPVEFVKYHATPIATAIAATIAPMIAPILSIAPILQGEVSAALSGGQPQDHPRDERKERDSNQPAAQARLEWLGVLVVAADHWRPSRRTRTAGLGPRRPGQYAAPATTEAISAPVN
jgi:hypothetical protein